jgi:predicted secreted protein
MNMLHLNTARGLAGLALVAATAACAQTLPPPQNVVSLSASATVELPMDWLTVVFSTTREGSDAAVVQSQLKQALDSALVEARKAAKPGQVEVRTGGFSLMPRYAPKGGTITGWQGSTELVVEGRDSTGIAQLTGRVQTLTISRVGFSLSREARQKVEGEVAAQAIERFRGRADAVSRQFGFTGYTVREVAVNADGGGEQPMPRMRLQASAAMADGGALPVEGGKATVTANVSGSVQMK